MPTRRDTFAVREPKPVPVVDPDDLIDDVWAPTDAPLTPVAFDPAMRAAGTSVLVLILAISAVTHHQPAKQLWWSIPLALAIAVPFAAQAWWLRPRMLAAEREPLDRPAERRAPMGIQLAAMHVLPGAWAWIAVPSGSDFLSGTSRTALLGLVLGVAVGFAIQSLIVHAAERRIGGRIVFQRAAWLQPRPRWYRSDYALSKHTVFLAPENGLERPPAAL